MGVIVAVDGGGSKTDVVAVTLHGEVVARERFGSVMPHAIGVPASVAQVAQWVLDAAGGASIDALGVYLSGLDLSREVEAYRLRLQALGLAPTLLVDNDVFALLRAGTRAPDAVAVVCGTGINAVGRRADGAVVRFPALGSISGDWGGGDGLGHEALWHAARAEDGRGPGTALVAAVCAQFGVSTVLELITQVHVGERDYAELSRLAPAVFAASDAGDAVASGLVDRLGDEVVTLAGTCLRRLNLLSTDVPVVLGGGILQAQPPRLMARVWTGLAEVAPSAGAVVLGVPPILGAAQLTLEAAGARGAAVSRLATD